MLTMRRFLARSILTLVGILLLTAGSPVGAESISFCEYGQSQAFSEKMNIDVEERLAIGTDTRISLLPLVDSEVVGFESPFPLVVPKEGRDVRRWASASYSYEISPMQDGDWIVIYADPIEKTGNYTFSTTLFSRTDGVISLRISRFFEGTVYSTAFYRCDSDMFFPEKLLRE